MAVVVDLEEVDVGEVTEIGLVVELVVVDAVPEVVELVEVLVDGEVTDMVEPDEVVVEGTVMMVTVDVLLFLVVKGLVTGNDVEGFIVDDMKLPVVLVVESLTGG